MILLHTDRTENPHTPKTHSSASNFCKYPSDIPQISLRHLQTSPRQAHGISREHKTLTEANRHRQTPKDTARCCLSMSGSVPWHLLSSVGMSCSLETPGGCLGGVWRVSGRYLSGIYGNWRRSDVHRGYVGSQSFQYGAKSLFRHSPDRQNFFNLTLVAH